MECNGNCAHETNPDRAARTCPRCPNATLCDIDHIPAVYLDCHRGTCQNCATHFGRPLTFVVVEFECSVCLEAHARGMRHPACQHIFCVPCLRRVMWPEIADIDPRLFGCPSDDDDDSVWDAWQNTAAGLAFNAAVVKEEAALPAPSMSCPVCREETVPDWATKTGNWA